MFPLIPGIIPFGLIMGTVAVNAKLSIFNTMILNSVVFAGASQLAAIDLLVQNADYLIIILTGLIINMRFILYSAAFAPVLKNSSFLIKSICAYLLTDQSYAVSIANEDKFSTNNDRVSFFLGNATCMFIVWHLSVLLGTLFGNFAPQSLSLDFAVPLSFMALVIPSLKTKKHKIVALYSTVASCLFYKMPFNTGLLITAFSAITLSIFVTRRTK